MKGREYNTDDRKKQGQHKRRAQIWTDKDNTDKSVCIAPAIQPGIKKCLIQIGIQGLRDGPHLVSGGA